MASIPIRPSPESDAQAFCAIDAVSEEIARLELLRRLSMGAAHTLNNAFTGILGETLCLLDERKDDPLVAEACVLIQQEIERCARLTRSVALRVQRREGLLDETNVATLLRGVEPLLRETVSRAVSIVCEIPEHPVYAKGASEALELLLLLEAHRVTRATTSGGSLRIAVECSDTHADLVLELRSESDALRAPSAEDAAWQDVVDAAADSIARRLGARVIDGAAHTRRLRLTRSG